MKDKPQLAHLAHLASTTQKRVIPVTATISQTMHGTLREMYSAACGERPNFPFELFLGELLDCLAAQHRLRALPLPPDPPRLGHPGKRKLHAALWR